MELGKRLKDLFLLSEEEAMNTTKRREEVLYKIQKSETPISATTLAKVLHVSRQLIVGDVALLRASGYRIIATPRGYLWENKEGNGIIRTIAVSHQEDRLAEEIYTIIDMGGSMLDVIVDHPIYGELCGNLHLYSRYDADQFLRKIKDRQATPLSTLTNGLHLHSIQCNDEEVWKRILQALKDKGLLYEK